MQIVSIVAPIITYVIDLLFVRNNEIMNANRVVTGNPIANEIIIICSLGIVFSVISIAKKKNLTLGIIGLILNLFVIIISLY